MSNKTPKIKEIPLYSGQDGIIPKDTTGHLNNLHFLKAICGILLMEQPEREFTFTQEHFDRINHMLLFEGRDENNNYLLTVRTRAEVDARQN